MDKITLSILCDNVAAMKEGIRAEHGFSTLIEVNGSAILFDTGQSDVFLHNANVLGKDLRNIDKVVLSHGHYDHTGGVQKLTQMGRPFKVIGHRDIFAKHYKKQGDGTLKFIGCPYTQDYLESRGIEFEFASESVEIAKDVFFISEVPKTTDFETGDPSLVVKDGEGRVVPDPFMDDASLYVKTPRGLVVVLGCSHRGVVNILRQILTLEGNVPILTIIGGTHLARVSSEQLEKTIAALEELNPWAIGVSHCTGLEAADKIHQRLGKRFFRAAAGTTITIDMEGGVSVR